MKRLKNRIKYGRLFERLDNIENYKEIDENDREDWERRNYGNWATRYKRLVKEINYSQNKLITPIDPIKGYCGWDYLKINYYLRYGKWNNGVHDNCRLKNEIVLLNWNIYNSPLIPQNIIMYRFVPDNIISKIISDNKKGIPFQEKGFLSATLSKVPGCDYEYRNVLKLYISKGIFGLCADIISDGEEEFIFPPNCFIAMIGYPYKDKDRWVYPCKLKQFTYRYNASV
ncbi:ADP-ribosyltransferase [Lactobacillus sp. PSON]|uniref:ADP-ribosyltransferase n=1 Tax=Lactobacillus sp. PSON TaxID=3455454 RepID=UPI004041E8C2